MKVLLTGASGFIGRHVLKELLQQQDYEISILARYPDKFKELAGNKRITVYKFDLRNEIQLDYIGNHDVLLHLAWDNIYNYNDPDHIKTQLPLHCKFVENVIKIGIKDITITGTCFEYGMLSGCLKEDALTNPVTAYGIAKDTLRKYVFLLNKNQDLIIKWIRPFYMYGPGQPERSLLASLDKSINEGKSEFNMSGGEQLRDYLPVEKVAEYIVKIAIQKKIIDVINCCNGYPVSVRNLVENFLHQNYPNHFVKLNLGYYAYSPIESMAFWGDTTKFKLLFNEKI